MRAIHNLGTASASDRRFLLTETEIKIGILSHHVSDTPWC